MYTLDAHHRFSLAMLLSGKTARLPILKVPELLRSNTRFASSHNRENIPVRLEPARQYDLGPRSKALADFCFSCKFIRWLRVTCKSPDFSEPDCRKHTEHNIMRFSRSDCCLCVRTCSLDLSMCREGIRSFLELLTWL